MHEWARTLALAVCAHFPYGALRVVPGRPLARSICHFLAHCVTCMLARAVSAANKAAIIEAGAIPLLQDLVGARHSDPLIEGAAAALTLLTAK
jgi:hypothetical protein